MLPKTITEPASNLYRFKLRPNGPVKNIRSLNNAHLVVCRSNEDAQLIKLLLKKYDTIPIRVGSISELFRIRKVLSLSERLRTRWVYRF